MDSDRSSNRLLGFRRGGGDSISDQSIKLKTLPLTLMLLIFPVAITSEASSLSKHRFLIDDAPATKVNSVNSTSPADKNYPVAVSPPPPHVNPAPVDDLSNNKTIPGPPEKTRGFNNGTKSAQLSPPSDAGGGKTNQTRKAEGKPSPETDQKPKEKPAPETDKKPKEETKPNPVPGKTREEEKALGDTSPPPPHVEKGEVEKKNKNIPTLVEESCDGVIRTCSNADMVACIKSFQKESKEAVILVQNVGDGTLKGSVSAEDTIISMDLDIPKHKYQKLNMGQSNKIVVKTGNGECVLQMDSFVSDGNIFMRFPSYEKLVTPINGAYLLIGTVINFGGMWTCCLVRRRKQRTGGGVPYQELEMGLPESASATEVVSAEGWDQGWDDDWDGDNAVKSPGGNLVGNISGNGLMARSSNKDGWENNWDD